MLCSTFQAEQHALARCQLPVTYLPYNHQFEYQDDGNQQTELNRTRIDPTLLWCGSKAGNPLSSTVAFQVWKRKPIRKTKEAYKSRKVSESGSKKWNCNAYYKSKYHRGARVVLSWATCKLISFDLVLTKNGTEMHKSAWPGGLYLCRKKELRWWGQNTGRVIVDTTFAVKLLFKRGELRRQNKIQEV